MIQECSHMKRILSAWENSLKKTGKESCDLHFFEMKDCSRYVFCTFHPGVTDKLAIVFQIMLKCPFCALPTENCIQRLAFKSFPFKRLLFILYIFILIIRYILAFLFLHSTRKNLNSVVTDCITFKAWQNQYYAGNVLEPVRNAFPQAYIS